MAILYPKWNIQQLTGYEPKTTFWNDFVIAERFGLNAIRETYNKVKKEWKDNIVYVAELYVVLNHKIWAYYDLYNETNEKVYDDMARLYDELWRDYGQFTDEMKMTDEERAYFFEVTD